jgi:hypothetical protein
LAILALVCLAASLANGEVVQRGELRVTFQGGLAPKALPRQGQAPVRVSVGAKLTTTDGSIPPRLRTMTIAINGAGQISPGLVPVCTMSDIQPSTTRNALRACRASLVGQGYFRAKVAAASAEFPAQGKLYAFNGRYQGHPAILAHVYGTDPVPSSFTLPFVLSEAKGTFATVLRASLARATGRSGYITALSLNLGRTVGQGPSRRGYLSAACPAPKGFGGAVFPFARAQLGFAKAKVTQTLSRSCKVRG